MKKILSLIFVFMISLLLVSCKDRTYDEPKDNTKFEDYLDETLNTIDADKVDERFGEIAAPGDYLEKIKFADTEIAYKYYEYGEDEPEDEESLFFWQDDEDFYIYISQYDFYTIPMNDLEDLYEEMDIEGMSYSELINMSLESSGLDIELDDFFDCVEFSIDDFEETDEKNVYLLRNEAIARFVADLADTCGADVDEDDIEDSLDELDKFECYVTYGNGKIRSLKFVVEQEEKELDQEIAATFTISFLYDQEVGICGIRFDVDMEYSYEGDELLSATGYYLISNTALELEATVSGALIENELDYDKLSATLKLDATSLTADATVYDGKDKTNFLNAELTLEENYVKSGELEIIDIFGGSEDKIVLEVLTGKKADLPDVDLDDAENLLKTQAEEEIY